MATNLKATWNIQLITDCPGCKGSVDLLEYVDFWDGRDLELGEHLTSASKNLEVVCPDCGHRFYVDLEY